MSELRRAIERVAKSFPGGITAVAAALCRPGHQVNPQVLRNQLAGNERHYLSISVAEEIVDLVQSDDLAHAAATQRNGVFVKLPDDAVPASDMAILELVVKVWNTGGDVGRAVEETLADGRVDRAEVALVRKAINTQISALEELARRLAGMAE